MAKYYYNDVLLPEIPLVYNDIEFPYMFIWKASGKYWAFTARDIFYYTDGKIFNTNREDSFVIYNIEIDGAEGVEEWSFYVFTNSFVDINANNILVWSNHDIPNGSADATEIYFYATYPKDENGNEVGKPEEEPEPEPEEPPKKYYYNGVLLPEVPKMDAYPHYLICQDERFAGYKYHLIFTNNGFNELYSTVTCNNQEVRYNYYLAENGDEWVHYTTAKLSNYSYVDCTVTPLFFTNIDIYTGNTLYMSAMTPVPEVPEEPEPEYDEKYAVTSERLIEFANTARKIVGSTATMTPEEMATAFGNVQTLIDTANAKTGGGDTDLTSAVGTLVEGYGSGGSSGGLTYERIKSNETMSMKVLMSSSIGVTGV